MESAPQPRATTASRTREQSASTLSGRGANLSRGAGEAAPARRRSRSCAAARAHLVELLRVRVRSRRPGDRGHRRRHPALVGALARARRGRTWPRRPRSRSRGSPRRNAPGNTTGWRIPGTSWWTRWPGTSSPWRSSPGRCSRPSRASCSSASATCSSHGRRASSTVTRAGRTAPAWCSTTSSPASGRWRSPGPRSSSKSAFFGP